LDFGDVRFVANDGSTILSYWMQSMFNGENATFWVKVSDNLSLSNAIIWMYYGNPTATSQSNGTNTFVVFDDFEGATIDTSTWRIDGQVTTSNTFAFTGSQFMEHGPGISLVQMINIPVTSDFRACAWFRDTPSTGGIESVLGVASQFHGALCGVSSDIETDNYITRVDNTYFVSNMTRTAAFHAMEVEYSDQAYLYIDGALQAYQGVIGVPVAIGIGSSWVSASGNAFWDSFYIRKCVRPEPVQGLWGPAAPVQVEVLPETVTIGLSNAVGQNFS
jgi:hypothetical protein